VKNAHFSRSRKGFTLVEMLIATSLIILLLLFLVTMTDSTAKTWKYASSKTEQFQEARIAFDAMTRRLSEATLNTYWDVEYQTTGTPPVTVPSRYIRKSELRFISGPMNTLVQGSSKYPTHGVFFQAPTGFVGNSVDNGSLTNLLNTSGFFLEISNTDPNLPPFLESASGDLNPVVPPRLRSRLMELREPSEKFSVYQVTQPEEKRDDERVPRPTIFRPLSGSLAWFTTTLTSANPPVRRLADNVVALIILPKLTPQDELARVTKNPGATPLAKGYVYDSYANVYDSDATTVDPDINPKNQLPPVVQVTMVAIDEVSAARIAAISQTANQLRQNLKVDGFFADSTKLADQVTGTAGDLTQFQAELNKLKLTHRVFTTNVSIRGAKWSRAQ
jgi:uncharacterized protein (TIGR02599 family)